MKNPCLALQGAIVTQLSTLAYPVYDAVPQKEPDNYIVVGEFEATPWGAKAVDGMRVSHTITCWSKYQGTKTVSEMLDAVLGKIGGTTPNLTAAGFTALSQYTNFSNLKIARYDFEGNIYRYGSVTFSYVIQEN